jgi:hypothetical protein
MVTAGQDRKLNIWNIVNGKHARSYKPDTSGGDELYKVCTPILYDTVVEFILLACLSTYPDHAVPTMAAVVHECCMYCTTYMHVLIYCICYVKLAQKHTLG